MLGNQGMIQRRSSASQAPTLVVAASDSKYPARSDDLCDGTADESEINSAIGELP